MESKIQNELINKIDRAIIHSTKEFTDNPTLNIALGSIPVFGPAIRTVMSGLENMIVRNRILDLFTSMREEVLLIDQTKIDQTYFDTEEFYDLSRRVFEYTVKTRDHNKIKLYARILVRASILNNARFRHNTEDFLMILLELSPADIYIAREVYNQQKDITEQFTSIEQNELHAVKSAGWDRLPQICSVDKAQFSLSITKLVRAGLVQQVIGTYASYIGDAYRITSVFRRLIQLIEKLE